MGAFRWTEEELAEFEKRKQEWKKGGTVREHTVDKGAKKKLGRPSKYGNVKTEAQGIKFDSRREAKRWMDLRLEELAGAVQNLQRQIVYPLTVNGMHICDYRADFVYERSGLVVEDAKGFKTPEFKLKAKLMLACHGITVFES